MSYLKGFVPDRREMEKAANRITASAATHGGKEPAAVAWLLTFSLRDVFTLKDWELEEAFWNVLRFAADAGQDGTDYGQSGGMAFEITSDSAKRTELLWQVQQTLMTALRKYLSVGVASFPEGHAGFTIARGYRSLLFSGRSLETAFYYMAAQLLARYGHRIRQCEGCPIILLTGRKDQRFHSKTCQIGNFVRRKRSEEREKSKPTTNKNLKRKKGGSHGKKG